MIEANRIQFRYSAIAIASNVVLEFSDQAGNVTKYGSIVSKLSVAKNQFRGDAHERSYLLKYEPICPRI